MFRSSYAFQIAIPLASHVNPENTIRALHDHDKFLSLNPLMTGYREVFSGLDKVDTYFAAPDVSPIKSYEVTEAITIVPCVGSSGKMVIPFLAHIQNVDSGMKWRVNAPLGVVLKAEFIMQRELIDSEEPGEPRDGSDWFLIENATLECAGWYMLFVKQRIEGAQRNICRELVEMMERPELPKRAVLEGNGT
ncbi:hypothetical protein V1525DRAFT_411496 [Lipomyces kononenkoae]|uniref:Uncharacterized protein n=1 Tax=Lipomyces kononenkoae TaxID=34357 RepID=A0ACC3STF1_LIPKO